MNYSIGNNSRLRLEVSFQTECNKELRIDCDLAVGRIVQDISHSRFWKSSAIFVLEDDPQNGVDHVDGHRSVLFLASPYARRGAPRPVGRRTGPTTPCKARGPRRLRAPA